MEVKYPNDYKISEVKMFFKLNNTLPNHGYLRITPCYFLNPKFTTI